MREYTCFWFAISLDSTGDVLYLQKWQHIDEGVCVRQ